MSDRARYFVPTMMHWGRFNIETDGTQILSVLGADGDPSPSPIGQSLLNATSHPARLQEPMVRRGWLERLPRDTEGRRRGDDEFVSVTWEEAFRVVANELKRVTQEYGAEAIYGGTPGWGSAGRFHHAQSQLHRFLNCVGGYVAKVNTYSYGAGEVIYEHIFGSSYGEARDAQTSLDNIIRNADLILSFGGIPIKNTQVNPGGISSHTVGQSLAEFTRRGGKLVFVNPVRYDDEAEFQPEYIQPRPNTDVAVMLGIAFALLEQGGADHDFLSEYTIGYEAFEDYLTGRSDNIPKTPEWAAKIADIPAERIVGLAVQMARSRTFINVTWSLQRAHHGEQTFWMAATLAAMVGQIGLPGGGVGFGYGSEGRIGGPYSRIGGLTVPQGRNNVNLRIPVARVCDMLLSPGQPYRYNGQQHVYPDIKLMYWCGGNPFHHHQDLNRMLQAWQAPDTIICHEIWMNATARHSDIILPVTSSLERNDIGRASNDDFIMPMKQAVPPVGNAKSDYDIFAGIAEKMHVASQFTEGLDEMGWLRRMYREFRDELATEQLHLPDFDTFWETDGFSLSVEDEDRIAFAEFRAAPASHPLRTPSGKIEIFSATIDKMKLEDCAGHPAWFEPAEWLGCARAGELHMISEQPEGRLHSQLFFGAASEARKIGGREPVFLNPQEASARNLSQGDTVRIFNSRGAMLAGLSVSERVRPGVILVATGAWYTTSEFSGLELAGNPNVLTRDQGASSLSQGCAAQTVLVHVELANPRQS